MEKAEGRLIGRVAVVTGASRGLGVAIARRLADEGAAVVCMARNRERLRSLAAGLGDSSMAVPCDVSDPGSVRAAFGEVGQRFGRLDLLVNNAAPIGRRRVKAYIGTAGIRLRAPRPGLCTDNGAMVAALGAELVARDAKPSPLDVGADSALPVTSVLA